MRRLLLTALSVPCLAIALESVTKAGDDAKKPLQGVWLAQSMEADGKRALAEVFGRMRFTFRFDKLYIVGNFNDDREEECAYKVDPTKSPKHLDITFTKEDKTVLAIYEVKGDELKICLRRGISSEGRPTEFATKPDSQLVLLVLKKQK